MNVYIESNFVLELALLQEQWASCEEILRLCEAGAIRIVIPAYSLAEPHDTMIRRHRQRKQMKASLDHEMRQLARTSTYAHRLSGFQDLTNLLVDSATEEAQRLEDVRFRLLESAEVIPLEGSVLKAASFYRGAYDLSLQDALIFASVLKHLEADRPARSSFLNRNSKDFDNPRVTEELDRHNCKLLSRFEDGYRYVRAPSPRSP